MEYHGRLANFLLLDKPIAHRAVIVIPVRRARGWLFGNPLKSTKKLEMVIDRQYVSMES